GDGAELERELRDGAGRGDAADLVGGGFGEVQRPVGPGDDVLGVAGRGGQGELVGDGASSGDAANRAGAGLGEPYRPVRAVGDARRPGTGGELCGLGDGTANGDSGHLVPV